MSDYVVIFFIIVVAAFTFTALVSDEADSVKSATYNSLNNTVTIEEQTP